MATKQKTEEKIGVDLIEETVAEVEAMNRAAAFRKVPKLLGSIDQDYFQLGLILSHIKANKWWKKGQTFKDCIEVKFGLKYRKAMYLLKIADDLVDSEVPWSKVESVGWTKLKEIAPVLNNDNVDDWVEKAETCNTLELKELVKAHKEGDLDPSELPEVTDSVSTLSFKVHSDQKEQILAAIEQAKAEVDSSYSTVALEGICTGYMAGASTVDTGQDLENLQEHNDRLQATIKTLQTEVSAAKDSGGSDSNDLESVVRGISDDPVEALSTILKLFGTIWPKFNAQVKVL